jgi:ribose transport system substrate-binding protein
MHAMRLFAAVSLASLVIGCGDAERPAIDRVTADGAATKVLPAKPVAIRVAFVLKSFTNPFFVEMAKGARAAQEEAGIDLQIKTTMPETSYEQQVRIVESQIKARVDAIVITPVDVQRLVPVLKKAQDAGIKLVNIDERLDPDTLKANGMKPVPFVGVNSEIAAYQAAKYAAAQVTQPSQAAIIEGIPGTYTSTDRKRGAQRAFAENANVRVVVIEAANWKADDAYEVAQRMFKAHPKIDIVYCANDLMAMGLIKYLHESGRRKVLVAGFDALDEAKHAIRAGQMVATVDQLAARQGYFGVMSALKLLRGDAVPESLMIETALVTARTLP